MTVDHAIDLSYPSPLCEVQRRYSAEKRMHINEQVRDMLRDNIIEPAKPSFSLAVIITGKKYGDYCFCVDYRCLNDQTVDGS